LFLFFILKFLYHLLPLLYASRVPNSEIFSKLLFLLILRRTYCDLTQTGAGWQDCHCGSICNDKLSTYAIMAQSRGSALLIFAPAKCDAKMMNYILLCENIFFT